VDYQRRDDGSIVNIINVGGAAITFKSVNIRRERSGIHAQVEIAAGRILLAYSDFNIDRDEDRTRIANSAHRHLGEVLQQTYPRAELKHDLDLYAIGLWRFYQGANQGEDMTGDKKPATLSYLLRPYILEGAGNPIRRC
jgi:hypothetical protein